MSHLAQVATDDALGGLQTDLPLALFPVRLETRFVATASGALELLVRVFPDDIQVDAHEPELTDDEVAWGEHFWHQAWAAGSGGAGERSAWAQLADRYGATRAEHVIGALRPDNLASRPAPGAPPTSAPRFPTPQRHAAPWTRAPYSRVLPDRWVALGYAGEQRVFAFVFPTVPDALAVAPGPPPVPRSGAPARQYDAASLRSDPDSGWLFDFAAAERIGMGLRIPYTLPGGATALSRLVVVGVKASVAGPAGAQRLETLLRAHRATSGLGFVAQGTQTNNTPAGPSGFTTLDPGHEAGYRQWRGLGTATLPDGSNGRVAARALGVGEGVFGGLRGAQEAEQTDARHMNNALWPATWGYLLTRLLAGEVAGEALPAAAVAHGRAHFVTNVRARGPLPALRVGSQPYGLLPAVSLRLWRSLEGTTRDAPIVDALRVLRDIWRQAAQSPLVVPRVPGSADGGGALLQVLAMEAVAGRHVVRPAQLLTTLPGPPVGTGPGGRRPGSGPAQRLATRLGLPWAPRHARAVFAPGAPTGATGTTGTPAAGFAGLRNGARVLGPLPEVLSETEPLPRRYVASGVAENYVGWLGRAGAADVAAETLQPRPDTLLYLLLRHAAILERAGGVAGDLASWQASLAHLAGRPAGALALLLGETLDLCAHRLDAWITSFATRRLEWLRAGGAQGTYLGGYGCVENLAPGARRTPLPWDGPPPLPVPPQEGVPPETSPLHFSEGSAGFVHAPSLAHATTAAILRSGYLSRRATGDGTALAVDLSSDRVRLARSLLDGVRDGLPLASLLGYHFERGLHEHYAGLPLIPFVNAFRRLAPLDVPPPPALNDPDRPRRLAEWRAAVAARSATGVVDGLALLRRWQAPAGDPLALPWGPLGDGLLPAIGTDAYRACNEELRMLGVAVDAVGDVLVAEAVHQTAQGNPARAGAALDAIGQGEAPPPDLAVVRTPRTGTGVTHRLAVLFNAPPAAPAGWPSPTARGAAEPFVNAWVARLLGPAAPAAACRVEFLHPQTGAALPDPQSPPGAPVPLTRVVTLAGLGLAPVDLLALTEEADETGRSELEGRIVYQARRSVPPDIGATASVRLSFARASGMPPSAMSVAEVLEVARTARRLVTAARAAGARDLLLPDATVPPDAEGDPPAPPVLPGDPSDPGPSDMAPRDEAVVPGPDGDPPMPPIPPPPAGTLDPEAPFRLSGRADVAVRDFRTALRELQAALPAVSTPPADPATLDAAIDPETLRTRLLRLAAFGLRGAVPTEAVGTGGAVRRALRLQAESVAREGAARDTRIAALERDYGATATPPLATTRDYHLARLGEVFGPDFRVLPRFVAPNGSALRQALDGAAGQGATAVAAVTWFQRVARVREGAARLDATLLYGEALGGATLGFAVAQLPYRATDRWVALTLGAAPPAGGRLSLALHAPASLDPTLPVCGLVVDEWTEMIPNPEETTGVAFHFDTPASRAPQAVLLAVAPDTVRTWTLDALASTVLETLDLARLRAVDLTALATAGPEVGVFLPAVYLAHSGTGEAATVDRARVAGAPA